MTSLGHTGDVDDSTDVRLAIVNGAIEVVAAPGADGSAELTWPADIVRVTLLGEIVEATSCRVPATASIRVEPCDQPEVVHYRVSVSRNRMEATLKVVPEAGIHRVLEDQAASLRLRIHVAESRIEPPPPTVAEAAAALQAAGVVHGLDPEVMAAALQAPGEEFVVAVGTEPIEGRNGYLERLVDFDELRCTGVLAETPLVRRIRKREGVAGRDVTGRDLTVPVVTDARIKAGEGVAVDEEGILAVATVDGSPRDGADGLVEVRHELELEEIDNGTGDIVFNGSVRVTGSIHEGRRLVARDEVTIGGNVDRAHVESGGTMRIGGSIMSSVLRAGGERAVAALIADRVLDIPKSLGLVAAQARQVRDADAQQLRLIREQDPSTPRIAISHALSIQLVLERIHREVLPSLQSVVEDLGAAGPAHAEASDRTARWHRLLATAANGNLSPERFQQIQSEVTAFADDVQRALEQPADLEVSYMQASEAESTGMVTLLGKGIFNSRIVAWGGLVAQQYEAVFRGGSIMSHGKVQVREVGSPAGAATVVQLGHGGGLEADRAFAGTVVSGPGYTHRFVADRTCIKVEFDTSGSMNVESLAA